MPYSIGQKQTIIEKSIEVEFGKLTVKKFAGYRTTPRGAKVPMMECQCQCGRIKTVSLWDLRGKRTKTCGFDHPHYEDRSQPAFNNLYNHVYKARALKEGKEFTLTQEEFRKLTKQPCHYCGCEPSGISTRQTGYGVSTYTNNGIDRKDNNRGYTTDNVVPCCSICNHAKHTLSYEIFLEWLNRIVCFRSNN